MNQVSLSQLASAAVGQKRTEPVGERCSSRALGLESMKQGPHQHHVEEAALRGGLPLSLSATAGIEGEEPLNEVLELVRVDLGVPAERVTDGGLWYPLHQVGLDVIESVDDRRDVRRWLVAELPTDSTGPADPGLGTGSCDGAYLEVHESHGV